MKRLEGPQRYGFDFGPTCDDCNEQLLEPLLLAAVAAPVDGGSAGASMAGQPADYIDADERKRVSLGAWCS